MKLLLKVTTALLCMMLTINASAQTNLDIDDFVKVYKSTPSSQLLDVRTPDEWSGGKLANSACVNYLDESFSQGVTKLDKDKPIFVYCAAGGRSAKASSALKDAGFKQVYNLKGAGYDQLKAKGL
jgi:rhodanese-related sulfurtransferase